MNELPLEDLLSLPLVESVSLRDQVLLDAPASVTVIREDQIRASGATNVAELLRLVPGLFVMQLTGNTYSIGLRGISRLSNDRVLILIDGHPFRDYVSGEARLGSLHVNPLDVVKIEVIRGPGSVSYGAGAFSGVVNILTKRPRPQRHHRRLQLGRPRRGGKRGWFRQETPAQQRRFADRPESEE